MSSEIVIPVFQDAYPNGWPEHEAVKLDEHADYTSIAAALSRSYNTDAHFSTYSVPSVNRRLATEMVFAELDAIPMVLFVVDVEPAGHAKVTPEWWATERAKIDKLLAAHPGGFAYRTRGGYRLVYQLAEPVVLACTRDAERWKLRYLAWLEYVREQFQIDGDRSCQDWTRLYRLPFVVRNGERQKLETIGDAKAIGVWNVPVDIPEPAPPPPRTEYKPKPGDFDASAFMASAAPGAKHYSRQGKDCWDVVCPWESNHSSSSRRDTVVTFDPTAGPTFNCFHNSCQGPPKKTWKDFRRFHQSDWVPFDERPASERRTKREPPRGEQHKEQHPNAPASESDGTWTKPSALRDHLPPVDAFCVDYLPADLQAWVCDIAHRMSVPVDMVAIAAMCAVSVVATNARTIRPKRYDPWRVYPILWGVAIAPPGSKKTPSANEAFRPLELLDLRSRQDFQRDEKKREVETIVTKAEVDALKNEIKKATKKDDGETNKAEIAAKLAEILEKQDDEPKPRRFVAQDATIEKLTDIVTRGPKQRSYPLAIRWDELLGFLRGFDKEGRESDRAFYLSAWSAQTYTTDRVSRGSIICRDLALVVFGNMTPEPFEDYVNEALNGSGADGLLPRFQLAVYPDRMPVTEDVDQSKNTVAERRAIRLFERLAAIDESDEDGKPPALHFDNEAQEFYFAWARELMTEVTTSDEHVSWRSHLAKYASLMPALALICHLADREGTEGQPVTLWAAQQAAGWCQYLKSHARRIYSLVASREYAAAVFLAKRIECGDLAGTMKAREVYRRFRTLRPEAAKEGLQLLEDLGWLRLFEDRNGKSGGRPSEMVVFNPLAKKERPAPQSAAA